MGKRIEMQELEETFNLLGCNTSLDSFFLEFGNFYGSSGINIKEALISNQTILMLSLLVLFYRCIHKMKTRCP